MLSTQESHLQAKRSQHRKQMSFISSLLTLKPVIEQSCISAERYALLKSYGPPGSPDRVAAEDGQDQGMKHFECTPNFARGECEEVLRSKTGNAFIILGRDRPHDKKSGYGGVRDQPGASAIRLTAGMGGRSPREQIPDPNDEKKFLDHFMNPNNQNDAATIYLSQKTNIDDPHEGFNLAKGTVPLPAPDEDGAGTSAIAMKADSIRIASRTGGVKIVAGGTSQTSGGGNAPSYSDINFICGNDDRDLQPLVKGRNMIRAIKKIYNFMDKIYVTINSILMEQNALNVALMTHTHIVPPITIPQMEIEGQITGYTTGGDQVFGQITPGTGKTGKHIDLVTQQPIAPLPLLVGNGSTMRPGFTDYSPEVLPAAARCTEEQMSTCVDKIAKYKMMMIMAKNNATLQTSTNYILSNNVHTT